MSKSPRLCSLAVAVFVGAALQPLALNAQPANAPGGYDTTVVVPVVAADTSPASASAVAGPRKVRDGFAPVTRPALPLVQGSSGSESLGAGSNVALMGVGVAGILAGSLIDGEGGTMISIGGGIVALIGLFRYLR